MALGHISFFRVGPRARHSRLLIGTIVITVICSGELLLPERGRVQSIPADLSAHLLRTRWWSNTTSKMAFTIFVSGKPPHYRRQMLGRNRPGELSGPPRLVATARWLTARATPLQRSEIAEGDLILVRGEAEAAGRLAWTCTSPFAKTMRKDPVAEVLLNRASALG